VYESIHFESTGRKTTTASKPEVLEKLRALVGEENVVVDPDRVEPYGADAVKEKFPPEAVVFPESTTEMVAILKLANKYLFPITARGGGVGYTGGAVPVDGGIVIGTDRMNKIIDINVDDLYAICQPGLTTFELQQAVSEKGLLFAPDPASYKDSFIGGNIAENAGGMRTPKYGVTKHHVLGLEVVTATGEIIRTGGKTVKNVVGFDLTGLMCGSEGMLGIITEATLKLLPMPEATSTVRANFHSMEAACKVLTKFTPEGLLPMAMEVIDKFCVEAVEQNFAFGLSKDANAILLVAVDGSRGEVEKNAATIERIIGENGGFDIVRAKSKEEEDKLWDVRRAISPSLMKFGTLKINEDVVVPRSKVPETCRQDRRDRETQRHFRCEFRPRRGRQYPRQFCRRSRGQGRHRKSTEMCRRDISALRRPRRHDLRGARHRLRQGSLSRICDRPPDAGNNERNQKGF
jgi:glycolate oxidase